MIMVKDEQLVQDLLNDIQDAQGYDSDVLSDKRAKSLDYYFGHMSQTPPGRSQIVSHDVADTVHALMSQITTIYKSSSIEFTPHNEQDEEQANLESEIIKTVIENNDEYKVFESATFDALLQGNGWIKVGVELESEYLVQRIPYQTDAQARQIETAVRESYDVIDIAENINTQGQMELVINYRVKSNNLVVEAIAPENMLFTGYEDCTDLDKLTLVAERKLFTVSDLIDLGLSYDDAIACPSYGDAYTEGARARQGIYAESLSDMEAAQEASRLKETFICYYLADTKGNGERKRYRIHIAGSTIIDKKPVNYVPYVTGSPLPVPHRIPGQGMYEIIGQIQEAKTYTLRNFMDNLAVMNQSRVGYLKGEVDVEDLLNGRVNGIVGMDRPDAIIPLPSNDIGMQAINGLSYLDQVRTQRGGAALDLNNSEMQIAKASALGAANEYAAKEKMSSHYCRNLANSLLKPVFLLVHKVMREEMSDQIQAKVKGNWITVDPATWLPRKRARVIVGMSNTERQQKIMTLNAIMQQQQMWIQAGLDGVLTDITKVYNAALDWIAASDVTEHPETYLINPESDQAVQAQQQKAQQAAEQAQAAQEQQEEYASAPLVIETMRLEQERDLKQQELKWKYFDTISDNEMKEAEMTIDATEKMINTKRGGNSDNRGKSA